MPSHDFSGPGKDMVLNLWPRAVFFVLGLVWFRLRLDFDSFMFRFVVSLVSMSHGFELFLSCFYYVCLVSYRICLALD